MAQKKSQCPKNSRALKNMTFGHMVIITLLKTAIKTVIPLGWWETQTDQKGSTQMYTHSVFPLTAFLIVVGIKVKKGG